MTPDLTRLREKLDDLESLVRELELELVDEPNWEEPSGISYLSAKDRENPDIMSNVEAMAATNKLIAWFGRDHGGLCRLVARTGERSAREGSGAPSRQRGAVRHRRGDDR